jgi:toxin FitB
MIVIDSSFWIEFFNGSDYGKIIRELNDYKEKKFIVPAIIIYEVYKQILLKEDESVANFYTSHLQQGKIIDLDFFLSIYAAKLGKQFKLPLADSIIYATSLQNKATLYTTDKHFKGLPGVEYFKK